MSRTSKITECFRVMVVDDHAQARESVAHVLREAGYDVAACASAVEALGQLARQSIDVVITDLQMPGMDGLEFIREIERRRLGVQVLMITAHASVSSAVAAMRHGAFDYLENHSTWSNSNNPSLKLVIENASISQMRPLRTTRARASRAKRRSRQA